MLLLSPLGGRRTQIKACCYSPLEEMTSSTKGNGAHTETKVRPVGGILLYIFTGNMETVTKNNEVKKNPHMTNLGKKESFNVAL